MLRCTQRSSASTRRAVGAPSTTRRSFAGIASAGSGPSAPRVSPARLRQSAGPEYCSPLWGVAMSWTSKVLAAARSGAASGSTGSAGTSCLL